LVEELLLALRTVFLTLGEIERARQLAEEENGEGRRKEEKKKEERKLKDPPPSKSSEFLDRQKYPH